MKCKLLLTSLLILSFLSIIKAQNDNPCGASVLAFPGNSCGSTTSLTVSGLASATPTTTPASPTGCPAGVGGSFKDRWFQFTVPPGRTAIELLMNWSGCSGFLCTSNPGFAWYASPTNNCNNLVLQDCDGDDGAFASSTLDYYLYNLTPGATYWVRVWETDNQGGSVAVTGNYAVNNDFCAGAAPLQGLGTNCDATNINEPDTWVPGNVTGSNAGCPSWFSNENGVWYTFAVTPSTPQPVTIGINSILCTGGGGNLQIGVWTNNGTCNLGSETFIRCDDASNGNINVGPMTLAPGNYYVYVDGNAGANCTWQFSSPQLLVSLTNNGPKCANIPTTLSATINQGTAPYNYKFSGPGLTGIVNNGAVANLALPTPTLAGTYTVTITDSSVPPQAVTATTVVTVLAAPPTPTNQPTAAICPSSCATLNAGTATSWLWSTGATTQTISACTAGTYTVTTTNASGCTATASTVVTQSPSPAIPVITPSNGVVCGLTPLTLDAGTGYTTYAWSGGTAPTLQQNPVNAAGTYTCTVSNAAGCTATGSVTVSAGTAPAVTLISTTCNVAGTFYTLTFTAIGTAPMTVNSNGSFTGNVWTSDPIAVGTTPPITVTNLCGTTPVPYTVNCGVPQVCDGTDCFAANLFTNGNFESGAAGGFTADNCAALATTCGGGLCEYRYGVFNSATGCIPSLNPNVHDHTFGTPNTGKMMVVNYPAGVVADRRIWCQSVSLAANTNYCFGGYFINLLAVSQTDPAFLDPQFTLSSNGTQIGTTQTAPQDETWHFNGYQFNSGATAGVVTLCINSANEGQLGNDLGIDDISIRAVQPGNQPITQADNGVLCNGQTTVTIPLTANDLPGAGSFDYNTLAPATPNSTVSVQSIDRATGNVTFAVTAGFVSPTTFNYQICNTTGCCQTGTVTITSGTATASVNSAVICAGASATHVATSVPAAVSYLWNTTATTPTITVSPTVTTVYTVTTTSANGCTATATGQLTVNPLPTAPIITGPNTVCGNSITLTAAGLGTFAWTASGGGVITSPTNQASIQTTTAGTYTVVFTDANGCTASASKIVTPGSATLPNISVTPICPGGTVTLAAVGSGYTAYAWSGGGTTPTKNVTTAGPHTVTVTGSGGCTATASVTPVIAATLLATATPTNILCRGGFDGAITINATGGTAPYSYSADGSAFSTSNTFSGLSAGPHPYQVKDANNCLFSASANVTEPATAATVSVVSQTNVPCTAGSVGSVTVAGAGGTGTFTYSLGGGAFQAGTTFSGLSPNTYTITVRDANACTAITTVNIISTIATVTPSATVTANSNCANAPIGSIAASAIGGTAPYSYQVDNIGGFVAGNIFTNLSSGTHVLQVRDVNGCTGSTNFNITQGASTVGGSVLTQTNIAGCNAGNTGAVTISPSGGSAPYSYSIDNGPAQGGAVFNNLSGGGHSVRITDANGCTAVVPVTIIQTGSSITGTATVTNATCNMLGAATITPAGGAAPYTFSLNGSAFQSNPTFSNLPIGIQPLTIKDNLGCIGTVSVNIVANPVTLTVGASVQPVRCTTLGSAVLSATNGAPQYFYSVDGGPLQSNNAFANLIAGSHVAQVTDANGCTSTAIFVVTNAPATLSLAANNTTAVTCSGTATGTMTLSATGGVAPYQYSNGGAFQNNSNFSGLVSGTYNVIVRDNNGCTASTSVAINQPSTTVQLTFANITNATCYGASTGSFTLVGNGGVLPYTYSVEVNASWIATTNPTFNNLAEGAYRVRVTDVNGCTDDHIINIRQPSIIVPSVSNLTNVLCAGGNTGSATVTASGGTTPYQYAINGGANQTVSTFTNLGQMQHTVIVTDARGCTASVTANVASPSAINTLATNQSNVTCFGASDGRVIVNATGGTSPYLYNNSNNNVFSGLAAGSFNVTVTDANGCSKIQTTPITQPNPITIAASASNVSCNGGNNGTISLNPNGGTPPYRYSVNGGSYDNNSTIANITSGVYTIAVSDANGCTASRTAVVAQPSSVVSGIVSNLAAATCNGVSNGSATIVGSGGVLPYMYSIGGTFVSSGSFIGLPGGNYTASVRDANGCIFTTSFVINQPAQAVLATAQNVTNNLCANTAAGSFVVTAAGGGGTYTYSLNGGAFGAINSYSGLANSAYNVIVKDVNNCTNNVLVNITSPIAMSAQPSSTNILCAGSTVLGTASVVGAGGLTPYTYYLDGSANGQPNGSFANLTAGQHNILIKDANNCSIIQSITITEPPILGLTLNNTDITNVTCNGANDGKIVVSGTGGLPTYQFKIDGGAYQLSGVFAGIAAGPHTVFIKDVNGCATSQTFTIAQPASPLTIPTASAVDVKCNGGDNGQVTVNPSGGTAPYTYLFTPSGTGNFGTNNVFNNLTAGTYTVTVKDANGCTAATTRAVTEPTPLEQSISNTTIQNVLCAGGNSGSFVIAAAGGLPPYRFSAGGASFTTNPNFINQSAGIVPVIIKDANNCFTTAMINITQPTPLIATPIKVENIGCPGRLGSITVGANGGTGTYTYSTNGTTFQAANVLANLAAATYTVTVKDANGCTSTFQSDITSALQLVVNVSTDRAEICQGQSMNLIAGGNGGTGSYLISWGTAGNGTTIAVAPNTTTNYVVTVTDGIGCTNTASVTAIVNASPSITFTGQTAICQGQSATITAAGGTSYQWSNGAVIDHITATQAGIYNVIATSAKGCTASKTAALEVRALPIADAGTDIRIYAGEPFTLNASGAGTGGTYTWLSGISTPLINLPNPSDTVVQSTTYTVKVTDQYGCENTDEVLVELRDELECIGATEGFTPNGDDFNETWVIPCLQYYPNNTLEIINRWGQTVYSAKNYTNEFNAIYNGTTLPDGTYYYILRLDTPLLKKSVYKGTITVLR
jgi:gliding motility-associated-like protein